MLSEFWESIATCMIFVCDMAGYDKALIADFMEVYDFQDRQHKSDVAMHGPSNPKGLCAFS